MELKMKIQAALVREQGQTFAVVVVRQGIIDNRHEANQLQTSFAQVFNNVPIILMEQNSRGIPTYYGRTDIVNFLANINFRRLPWSEWTLN
jgi:hypothetical protein